jgi:hypothetical protein
MNPGKSSRRIAAFLSLLLLATAAVVPRMAAAQAYDPAQLEELVGPIALYPDDLLSITLQGSTYPLQIVEADRWIAANKGKKDAKPKDTWDDSVKALINYPDVVTKMSTELDWTTALGEAVATDQGAVMDAVQAFRRRADGAGNLQTDEKQLVEVEESTIRIVQADPQVIYVPQYEPQTIIVQQATPYYPTYYPTPYPVYYYPYPPGYGFASGFFWGAATAAAFDWHGGGIHDIDIDIDRNTNINRNSNRSSSNRATNIDRGKSQQLRQQGNTGWRSNASAGDVGRGRATQTGSRPATANRAGAGQGAANRASTGQAGANRAGAGQGAANRAGTSQAGANRAGAGQAGANRSASAGGYTRPSGSGASSRPSNTGSYNRSSSGGTGRYENAGQYGQSARSSSASRGGGGYSGGSSARSSQAFSSRGASSRGGGGGGGGGGGRRR